MNIYKLEDIDKDYVTLLADLMKTTADLQKRLGGLSQSPSMPR
jgi:hypothetical protein